MTNNIVVQSPSIEQNNFEDILHQLVRNPSCLLILEADKRESAFRDHLFYPEESTVSHSLERQN